MNSTRSSQHSSVARRWCCRPTRSTACAALPAIDRAVRNLFELKGRGAEAPIAVLCASSEQAFALARDVSSRSSLDCSSVLARSADARASPSSGAELGSRRACRHDRRSGPRPPADPCADRASRSDRGHERQSTRIRPGRHRSRRSEAQLGGDVVVVDGGRLGTVASTVVDATAEPWKVLRIGAVSSADLEAAGAPL